MSILGKSGASIIKNYPSVNKSSIRSQTDGNFRDVTETRASKESFNEQFIGREQKDFINEANKIMRERMKNKGSTINSKSRWKAVILKDTKEVCLKNYLIGLLKDKRTDINEKERNITTALKQSEKRLDFDYKDFVKFVEDTKAQQKAEEETLAALKLKEDEKNTLEKKEMAIRNKHREDLEKVIKTIITLKSYGSFVHQVLGEHFIFDEVTQLDPESRERDYEALSRVILSNFQKWSKLKLPPKLKDESFLLHKFTELEEKVIKILENKEVLEKEKDQQIKTFSRETKELEKRVLDCEDEENRIRNEKAQNIAQIEKLRPRKNAEVELILKYIIELGIETGSPSFKWRSKKNMTDYLAVTKEVIDEWEAKEKYINSYIDEIETFERTGNEKEKALIHTIEVERKNQNKTEKQRIVKERQDQLSHFKRQKAVERAQRIVIKGRRVPQDYPILKQKKIKIRLIRKRTMMILISRSTRIKYWS